MNTKLKKEPEQKIGKRKLQAEQTKQKIFDEARRLFKDKGIDKVGIADIVKAARVSTGTFYLYFSSKEEIIAEIYMGENDFFDSLPKKIKGKNCKERIVDYFSKANGHLEKEGPEIIRQLYYPSNPLMERGRGAAGKAPLLSIIQEGQVNKEITDKMKAEDIADYLYSLSSGIIFEWCLNGGDFGLQKKTAKFMEQALTSL